MNNLLEKLRYFFSAPSYSRTLALGAVAILVVALPITVIFLGQQTNIFQHASGISCVSQGGVCADSEKHSNCAYLANNTYQSNTALDASCTGPSDYFCCVPKPAAGAPPSCSSSIIESSGSFCDCGSQTNLAPGSPSCNGASSNVLYNYVKDQCGNIRYTSSETNSTSCGYKSCVDQVSTYTTCTGNTLVTWQHHTCSPDVKLGEQAGSPQCQVNPTPITCSQGYDQGGVQYRCTDYASKNETCGTSFIDGTDCNSKGIGSLCCPVSDIVTPTPAPVDVNTIVNSCVHDNICGAICTGMKNAKVTVLGSITSACSSLCTGHVPEYHYGTDTPSNWCSNPAHLICAPVIFFVPLFASCSYTITNFCEAAINTCVATGILHASPSSSSEPTDSIPPTPIACHSEDNSRVGTCVFSERAASTNWTFDVTKACYTPGPICPDFSCSDALPGTEDISTNIGTLAFWTSQCHPQAGARVRCCAPTQSSGGTGTGAGNGGGGGGTGPSCTNGQATSFALSLKLEGIGAGSLENNSPAHTTRNAIYVKVTDANNNAISVPNGNAIVFTYNSTTGTFNAPAINLGTALACSGTYKVTVKIPRYLPISTALAYGTNATLTLNPIAGDINKVDLTTKVVVGDDQITVLDYNLLRTCYNVDPTTPQTFTDNTNTVTLTCGDVMNFFDYQDGGTQGDEWSFNYNLWTRGYIKANGY